MMGTAKEICDVPNAVMRMDSKMFQVAAFLTEIDLQEKISVSKCRVYQQESSTISESVIQLGIIAMNVKVTVMSTTIVRVTLSVIRELVSKQFLGAQEKEEVPIYMQKTFVSSQHLQILFSTVIAQIVGFVVVIVIPTLTVKAI
jgi:hypothetical protein